VFIGDEEFGDEGASLSHSAQTVRFLYASPPSNTHNSPEGDKSLPTSEPLAHGSAETDKQRLSGHPSSAVELAERRILEAKERKDQRGASLTECP